MTKSEIKPIIKSVLSKALARFIIDEFPETGFKEVFDYFEYMPYRGKFRELYDRVCAINRMKAKRGHYIWEDVDEPTFIDTAYQVAVELINEEL